MTKFKSFLRGALLGLLGLGAGAVVAQTYYGWNPTTGLETTHGADVSGGALPTLSGCATISASVGGASAGKFATSGTSCNLTITFPSAAPNGWYCTANDITTSADKVVQTASTTTSCTFSGTTSAADVIVWNAVGF